MKKHSFLAMLLACIPFFASSQHPLYGTWKLESLKRTNPDGTPFILDTSQLKHTKIITPTHFMWFESKPQGDLNVFVGCQSGRIKLDGNKYYEFFERGSNDDFLDSKSDFTWHVKDDVFTQKGTFTFKDGRQIIFEYITYRREKSEYSSPDNPAIGTWDQISSSFVWDGKKGSHTKETHSRFDIITPTHWARISQRYGRFEGAICNPYQLTGNKGKAQDKYASVDFIQRVKGDTLYMSAVMTGSGLKNEYRWDDVFIRVRGN